eukprot:TRINITY_DN18659_c1_g1_i1.p1 TRINITY_DN18659_c1_g1~~TRINITY_DN18659_c1_g1_i1.p1  ORF type:complete len:432 (-),score=123.43 TRINITY_DN18659_c1_g1_i1:119-1339(-)
MACDYAQLLREDSKRPSGAPFFQELWAAIVGIFTPPTAHHFRVCSRYWNSLMACFIFSVFIDNYSGACAITAVFLINTRIGPDVMAMIQGLLSVVVGVVFNALMYSFSCKYGSTYVLMFVSFFYWLATIFVAKGGSSLAGVGLMMAALAPFAIIVACPAEMTPAMDQARAVGLWGSIRALLIAVILTVLLEIAHIPGRFTGMTVAALTEAFTSLHQAQVAVFNEEEIDKHMANISAKIGEAEEYNTASKMEPRLWMAPWKSEFLLDTTSALKKARADLFIMKLALTSHSSEGETIFKTLNKCPECGDMKSDLANTIADAKALTTKLLEHDHGKFLGLQDIKSVKGIDVLDGLDEAIDGLNHHVSIPEKAPENLERDELVQLSIVFVMLEFLISHVAGILKAGVRLT